MTLGKPIARGRTAEVYPWSHGQILKLFHPWFPEAGVRLEARLARAVQETGLPVPAVGRIVEVDGRLGLEYERVEGMMMWEGMASRPWRIGTYARLLADRHALMHGLRGVEGLPCQRERLADRIRQAQELGSKLREAALSALETMPAGDRLCHGDFHPGNIIQTDRRLVVIDWIDATRGESAGRRGPDDGVVGRRSGSRELHLVGAEGGDTVVSPAVRGAVLRTELRLGGVPAVGAHRRGGKGG